MAKTAASKLFLWTPEEALSYAEANRRITLLGAGLRRRGVMAGDRVLFLMDNSVEQVLLWAAAERIGAVTVPVNPALSGGLLTRAIRMVRPSLAVVDSSFAIGLSAALCDAELEKVPCFIREAHRGHSGSNLSDGWRPLTELGSEDALDVEQFDELSPSIMLFTSGSTGVPKACVLSRRYVARAGEIHTKYLRLTSEDVLFTPFPLFHIDAATLTVSAAVATGATAALTQRFSASRFWEEVRASGATIFNFMGATANILWKQPRSDRDRDHRVRLAWGVPMPSCEPSWEARFGFPLVEVYGLTDAGVPAYQSLDLPRIRGSCGRIIPEYTVRIGDSAGKPVADGDVGEILIRGNEPGLVMTEYFGMSEATALAFRGGWFHTGDCGSLDSQGNLYFAARATEVIRRRGENIAATDIESGVDKHPAVLESAAVGVPSELSEDDIRVFVVVLPGANLTPPDVVDHCRLTLPRYMVPRFVDLVAELPKTATEKIERAKLARLPLNAATWDCESMTDVQAMTEGRGNHAY